jgi:hypothetical protein
MINSPHSMHMPYKFSPGCILSTQGEINLENDISLLSEKTNAAGHQSREQRNDKQQN